MSAIDFYRSRAILIGTAHYTHGLTEMPAAHNSLNAMADLLTGPLCGWPKSRVTIFQDKTTRDGLWQEAAPIIHDSTDVVLFYYVGHGQLLDGEELGMALVDTRTDPKMRHATSLRLNDLRHHLKYGSNARVKLVILDCCFSGLATKNTQGTALADQIQLATKVEGAYTLTASRASQTAIHEDGPTGLTFFTKVFTEVVRDGIPGRGAELTLRDIYKEVAARFLRSDLPGVGHPRPEPSKLVVDTAEELLFARNTAEETRRPAKMLFADALRLARTITGPRIQDRPPEETAAHRAQHEQRLSFIYAIRSHVGLVRDDNTDSGYASPDLLVIADGMGEQATGAIASTVAVETLTGLNPPHTTELSSDPMRDVDDRVKLANTKIRALISQWPELEDMGTTVTALFLIGDSHVGLAHIGNSRAYRLRGGALEQISTDHTWVQRLIDEGQITEDEAERHPRRSLLIRALGTTSEADIDLTALDLQVGDRFLLCSDGLSGSVPFNTIAATLSRYGDRYEDQHRAVEALMELALRSGGADNITCIVAMAVSQAQAECLEMPVIVGASALADRL